MEMQGRAISTLLGDRDIKLVERPSFQLQLHTQCPELGDGFIDLVIETSTHVIGVEVKLNAEFQDDQPKKYLKNIQTRAGGGKNHVIVVLAPLGRETEVKGVLPDRGGIFRFARWECLLKVLVEDSDASPDQSLRFLVSGLNQYYLDYFNPFAWMHGQEVEVASRARDWSEFRAFAGRFLPSLRALKPLVGANRLEYGWERDMYIGYDVRLGPNPNAKDSPVGFLGFVNRRGYGLRDAVDGKVPEDLGHWPLVLCLPSGEDAVTNPALALRQMLVDGGERKVSGIIRHSQIDGQVFAADSTLLMPQDGKWDEFRLRWEERLMAVFGRGSEATD
jgi:hypothetical protein